MSVAELILERRADILRVAAEHGARNVRVFGSVARGEADERSDIDFLVDLEPGRSLLDLGGLVMDLAMLLDRPVDVVTERGLRARASASASCTRLWRCEGRPRAAAGHPRGDRAY